jgi:carbon starvation protein CstA
MASFLVGLVLLVAGYYGYGWLVGRAAPADPNRRTPAYTHADGVDYVAMPTWRIFLIQLLNIAGLGPVFGPIMGALWGPQVFLWVVLGSILGGAVHDYFSGVMSIRNNGAGLPDLIGHYLGRFTRTFATFFILVLMVLVGTVFVKGPAKLIVELLPAATVGGWFGDPGIRFFTATFAGQQVWLWVVMLLIFVYYVLATLLPIDQLIGRIYPVFAACLLIMVVGLGVQILLGNLKTSAFTLANLHPKSIPAWPIIFITVSCGAISGFHATQSPLMARCLKNERHMRVVFYGAMIAEALIALVWAAAAPGYYGGVQGLTAALGPQLNDTAVVVHKICVGTMGTFGGVLAVLGVVVLPITSGDTAFRVGRLILADFFKLPQGPIRNRYVMALPLFAISIVLNFVPFGLIWRYFGWANQALAVFTLWAASVYLARRGSRWWWVTALPATFMTIMTTTFILVESRANGCLGLDHTLGTVIGLGCGALVLGWFLVRRPALAKLGEEEQLNPAPRTEVEKQSGSVAV